MSDPGLHIWTVYDHPKDYPDSYVAREFVGLTPTSNSLISHDLEMLRTVLLVDMQLTCLTRDLHDDPKIIEVWL
jgi:hypothetical protein